MRAFALDTIGTARWAQQGFLLALTGLTLAACASGPRPDLNAPGAGGAPTSRYTGYKVGQPYQVKGVWYYPKDQPNYDEIGIASWYGEQFHNRYTADGEVFDMNMASAAHKTLPLPSLVEVTNLANGRTVVVRVNDRGPFVDGRVIDMSKAGAAALGFVAGGITKVRVRYVGRAEDPPGLKTPQNQTPPDLRQYQASLSKDQAALSRGAQDVKTGNRVFQLAGKAASMPLRLVPSVPVPMPPAPTYASAAPLAAPAASAGLMAASAGAQATHAAIADVDSLFSGTAAAPATAPPMRMAQAAQVQAQPEIQLPSRLPSQPQVQPPAAPQVQQMAPQVGYELQAGTFPTQEAADHFASSLTGDGLPEVQPFEQGGQTAYRVVVHGLSSPAQAAAAKSEAMALGSPDPRITTAF